MLYAQVAQEEEGEPTRRKRKEKSETLEKFFRKLGFGELNPVTPVTIVLYEAVAEELVQI